MTKRLTKPFMAIMLFLGFLLAGLYFLLSANLIARAYTINVSTLTLKLNHSDCFVINNGELTGIQIMHNIRDDDGKVISDGDFTQDIEDYDNLIFVIPSGVTKINALSSPANVLNDVKTKLSEVYIPDGVCEIAANAFQGYTNLKKIVLPNGIAIGDGAFSGCTALVDITLPDYVASIGKDAFKGCPDTTIGTKSGVYTVGGIKYIGNWVIGNDNPSSPVNIPDTVVGMSQGAFDGCGGDIVTAVGGVKYVGNWVVGNDGANGDVVLKDDTIGICSKAFDGCSGVTSVSIPGFDDDERGKVKYTALDAFDSIPIVTYRGIKYKGNIIIGIERGESLTGKQDEPKGVVEILEGTAGIKPYSFSTKAGLTNIIIPDSLNIIGREAFYSCSDLAAAEMKGVRYIGYSAFAGCNSLETVTIEGKDCVIGDEVFMTLDNLTNVTISGTVKSINRLAFDVCPKLSNLNITATVGSIGRYAFDECPITELSFKDGLTSIGYSAFYNCGQLKKLKIPSSIKTIDEYAFASCNSLQEIEIPNTVETISKHGGGKFGAFYDSKNIIKATVPVVALEHMTFSSNLTNLTINGGDIPPDALKNLKGLESVTLTEDVTSVGEFAFDGCTNLKNVTFESANTTWNNAFNNCGNPVFIAKDLTVYKSVVDGEKLQDVLGSGENKRTLTYPINLTLNGLDSVIQTKRLYGKEYNFVENGGVWGTDNTVQLPVQNGYSKSKWFNNSAYDGNSASINTWLAKQTTENLDALISELDLYALNINVGDVNGLQTKVLTYADGFKIVPDDDKVISKGGFESFLTDAEKNGSVWSDIGDKLVFKLADYTDASGNTALAANLPSEIKDAGIYTLEISLYDKYGAWISPVPFRVSVAKKNLDLYADSNINFIVSSGEGASLNTSSLQGETETIYLYKYDTDKIYPSLVPLESRPSALTGGSDWADNGTLNVPGVYTRYTGSELALSIEGRPAKFTVEEISDSSDKGEDIGTYITSFILTPHNNYSFVNGSQQEIISAENSKLIITINSDGTATVSKTWYILAQSRYLVKADDSGTYSISGFSFGNIGTIDIPKVKLGTAVAVSDAGMTFTLKHNGDSITTAAAAISRFGDYINNSMPVGNYELTFIVPQTNDDSGVVPGFSSTYRFVVTKGALDVNDTALKGKPFTAEYIDGVGVDIFKCLQDSLTVSYVTRLGVWNTDEYNDLYIASATPKFRLSRMSGGDYYDKTAFDTTYSSLIAPGKNATYTVYYVLDGGDNYNEFYSGDSRYVSYYTITVFKTISAQNIDSAIYNGSKLVPSVESNENYKITLPSNCVGAGEYDVVFTLYDREHFKWRASDGVTIDDAKGTAIVKFVIDKADNTWLRVPNIVGWEYGSFDAEVNRIRAVAQYSQSTISFAIAKADGTAVENLGAFVVSADGKIDTKNESLVSALNGLKAGVYKLVVTVSDTANYKALSESVDFKIGKAINTWKDGKDDLVLPSWIVGKYSAKNNPIVINATNGKVDILVTDIDGNVYYNSKTGVDKLNECSVGKYLVKASVEESADYAALAERTFMIEVFEREGLPWWATLCITLGTLLVVALVIFILWKKGVFEIVTDKIVLAIKTRISVEATIASVRAAKRMEEGKKSVADAKRRERIEEARKKAEEIRNLPPDERAAQLEARAQIDAERAEKIRARSEHMQARAAKLRKEKQPETQNEKPADETAEPATEE